MYCTIHIIPLLIYVCTLTPHVKRTCLPVQLIYLLWKCLYYLLTFIWNHTHNVIGMKFNMLPINSRENFYYSTLFKIYTCSPHTLQNKNTEFPLAGALPRIPWYQGSRNSRGVQLIKFDLHLRRTSKVSKKILHSVAA